MGLANLEAEGAIMNRRELLLGSISAAALGALGKPAPTPFVEGSKLVYDKARRTIVRTQLPKTAWRSLQNNDKTEWL